jgi:tRNA U54 and U55 pseudouridine synthase Pus10
MNEKEIRALIKEAEAAAKKYKAQLNAKSKSPDDARKANSKALSKMTPAEVRASKAVLENKKAMATKKLQNKNTAIANKIKGRGGIRGGGLNIGDVNK